MLWFNEAKGCGLIEAETGARVQVRDSAFVAGHVPVGRCRGLEVEFTLRGGAGGDVAADVSRSPAVDQRRTTHHRGARMAR
jgi:cold shock CspA family protein